MDARTASTEGTLIPNLVEAVKGYASHERATFEEVTKARTAAQQAQTVEEQGKAENLLTQAIGGLFAVAEAYPELRATENFQQLQGQLEETETKIAVSRQVYNDAVLTYDTALETGPDEHRRKPVQLRGSRVLRGRGARSPGGATRAVLRPFQRGAWAGVRGA